MKKILVGTFKKLLKLFPRSASERWSRSRNIVFTHWIKVEFKRFDENSIIERGLRIWNAKYISLGKNVFIRRFSNLSAWDNYQGKLFTPEIVIGDNCSIGEYVNISCIDKIIIGDNVLIGRWVTIIDHAHGKIVGDELSIPPAERELHSKGAVIIDENVWIGDKVTICSNVHIYPGAIIGANSVVTKDVPANTIVAGCPASIIKCLT